MRSLAVNSNNDIYIGDDGSLAVARDIYAVQHSSTQAVNGGSAYSYKKSAIVRYDGTIYISLVDNNEALPTDNTKWSELMMSNSTLFDGYLKTKNLLSEIKDKGTTSQQQARKNIGIDGDIAYRDKVNAFTKENTFSAETTFNKITHSKDTRHFFDTQKTGVSVANGLVWREFNQITFVEKAHIHPESDSLDIYSAKTYLRLKIISLNGVVVNVDGVDYISYHSGNLNPVRTVNYVAPDEKGNVNVNLVPDVNCDGAFSLVVPIFKPSSILIVNAGGRVRGSYIQAATIYTDNSGSTSGYETSPIAGLWRFSSPVRFRYTTGQYDWHTTAQRVPIGSIEKFSNIRNPRYAYTGSNRGTTINITCDIEGVGDNLTFTTSSFDTEPYGQQLYANAVAGMYGEVSGSSPDTQDYTN
ncbi:hypothetical protein [Citrobacter portucalensis]|uniref:hypothetical protein n=1 Tax=Citrobacter portucalensis TaxID=1639133 RepID=UPI00254C2DBF|nr:hypothetical protein [Citrobacter portucalensis]